MPRKIYVNYKLCTGCELCASICSIKNFSGCNPKNSGITIWRNLFESFDAQLICLHCEDAPCIGACISGAMYRDEKNGFVAYDKEKCVSCWMCIMVCPYSAITRCGVNSKGKSVVFKCTGCPEDITPPCVTVCPVEAIQVS